MTKFRAMPCFECGKGTVRLSKGTGLRRRVAPGVEFVVPDELVLPQCDQCGEIYIDGEFSRAVDKAIEPQKAEWSKRRIRELVDRLQSQHPHLTLSEIEAACAVTPTYFSHLTRGRKCASLTLMRLLEAFAACPSELARHRATCRHAVEFTVRPAKGFASPPTPVPATAYSERIDFEEEILDTWEVLAA